MLLMDYGFKFNDLIFADEASPVTALLSLTVRILLEVIRLLLELTERELLVTNLGVLCQVVHTSKLIQI